MLAACTWSGVTSGSVIRDQTERSSRHLINLIDLFFRAVIAVIKTPNIQLQNHFEQWLVKGERVEEGGGGSARVRVHPCRLIALLWEVAGGHE